MYKKIVLHVGYLLELYGDASSPEYKKIFRHLKCPIVRTNAIPEGW
jgi:hypothetical protein